MTRNCATTALFYCTENALLIIGSHRQASCGGVRGCGRNCASSICHAVIFLKNMLRRISYGRLQHGAPNALLSATMRHDCIILARSGSELVTLARSVRKL